MTPLPTTDTEAALMHAAAEWLRRSSDHYPERRCLGCGGSLQDDEGRRWNRDCTPHGLRVSLWAHPDESQLLRLVHEYRWTYRRLASVSGRPAVQENLGL